MSRYIKLADALQTLADTCYLDEIDKNMQELPSIDIVRCKECKFLMKDGRCYEFADDYIKVKPDDFCSYGERREP